MSDEKNLTFSKALDLIKEGKRLQRSEWNGVRLNKTMYVSIQKPDLGSKMNHPYLYLTTGVSGKPYTLVPWLVSQTDLLASDWQVVE